MTWIKICGLTRREDIDTAIHSGIDALGFNFYKKSPRYVKPEDIKDIPSDICKVGVFVNEDREKVKEIASYLSLDYVQLHGDEDPLYCDYFGKRVIKALRVKESIESLKREIQSYQNVPMFLLDTHVSGQYGGTGKTFPWDLIYPIDQFEKPIIISGGLGTENVRDLIHRLHPYGVDACSKLESSPGRKDPNKIKEFVRIVKKNRQQKQ